LSSGQGDSHIFSREKGPGENKKARKRGRTERYALSEKKKICTGKFFITKNHVQTAAGKRIARNGIMREKIVRMLHCEPHIP